MIKKLLVVASLVLGCLVPQDSTGVGNPGLTQQEQALVDDGDESTKTGDSASSLVSIPMLALDNAMYLTSETAAATRVELATTIYFTSMACLTAVRETNKVTFTFANCTGRLGLAALNGKMVATYKPAGAGQVSIDIATQPGFTAESIGRDLRPITANVTLTANALISFEATTRRIRWNGDYVASVGVLSITHQPTYDIVVDTGKSCVSVNGSALTNATRPSEVDMLISGYERCGQKNACPTAGGKVTYTRKADGAQLTIEFLGGTAARVTGPKRQSITLPNLLKCSTT